MDTKSPPIVLLSTIAMGAKSPLLLGNRRQGFTYYAQLQDPWTPRLLLLYCSAPLIGTKSPTTWPGDLIPPFSSYSQPSKCSYHSSRQSKLPRDYLLPRHSPGSWQSCANIAALVDSYTVSCSVVNHHHTLNSFVPLFVRGYLFDAIGLLTQPHLMGWLHLIGRQYCCTGISSVPSTLLDQVTLPSIWDLFW